MGPVVLKSAGAAQTETRKVFFGCTGRRCASSTAAAAFPLRLQGHAAFDAIHLIQQRGEEALLHAAVGLPRHAVRALGHQGVDLVEEDDARRLGC